MPIPDHSLAGPLPDAQTRRDGATFVASDLLPDFLDAMPNGIAYCRMSRRNGVADDFEFLYVNPAVERLICMAQVVDQRVTERRWRISEERHRLLAENATDVIWAMGPGGSIRYVSPSVERLRGFTPVEVMQQKIDEIHTPASQARSLECFGRLFAALQAGPRPEGFRGELAHRYKDGSTVWAEVMTFPLMAPEGTFVELLGVSRDIGEPKRHERELLAVHEELRRHRDHLDELVVERTRELAAARDAAESANRAKSALLAHVSHELRTPLTHITGYAYLLSMKLEDPKQKRQAETINDSAAHLLRLVVALLDAASLESEELVLEPAAFELTSLVDLSIDAVRDLATAKGISISREVDPALPRFLIGDPIRLGQVFHHLLDNAAKFSDGGHIAVRVAQIAQRGRRIDLRAEIADQGIGITDEQRQRLFELFELGDSSNTRRHGGAGLGLGLSRRLVSLMAGDIGVESAPGKGSTFWFSVTLPVGTEPQGPGEYRRRPT